MQAEEQPASDIAPGEIPPEQTTRGKKTSTRRRRVLIVMVVCLINLALLALLGWLLLVPAQTQSNAGSSSLIGQPAPDFTLSVLSAHQGPAPTMHLASLKGKPLVLNFWASWCDPCKQEAPLLQKTWLSVQRQGIIFLGIDFQDARGDALNFLHTYGITYPSVVDDSGSTATSYGIAGLPVTFFIDRRGVIVSKVTGELTKQALQSNLQLIAH